MRGCKQSHACLLFQNVQALGLLAGVVTETVAIAAEARSQAESQFGDFLVSSKQLEPAAVPCWKHLFPIED